MFKSIFAKIISKLLDRLENELADAEKDFEKFFNNINDNTKIILKNEDNIKKIKTVIPIVYETKLIIKDLEETIQKLKQKRAELQDILTKKGKELNQNDIETLNAYDIRAKTYDQIKEVAKEIHCKKGDLTVLRKKLKELEKLKDEQAVVYNACVSKGEELENDFNEVLDNFDENKNQILQVVEEKNKSEATINGYYHDLSQTLQPSNLLSTGDMGNFIVIVNQYIEDTTHITNLKKKIDETKPPKAHIMTKK